MTDEQTEIRAIRVGDLWTLTRHENPQHPKYWLTHDAAQEHADDLNRVDAITRAIRSALGVFATVGRRQMGGGRLAWMISFPEFDTVDGPYLLLTDDTDDFYVLGIYDDRQEVPGGPEPIVETTRFRVEAIGERWDTAAAKPRDVAMFIRDRALFVLGLARGDAEAPPAFSEARDAYNVLARTASPLSSAHADEYDAAFARLDTYFDAP